MQRYYYMQPMKEDSDGNKKPDGKIFRTPLNDWQRHRVAGCEFVSEEAFKKQQSNGAEADGGDDDFVTMENTKAEIQAFADKLELEYEDSHTKAELLTAIAEVLEVDAADLGVS